MTPVASVVVDTGPLYALSDRADPHHEVVKSYVEEQRLTLVVPSPVLPEFCYLARRYLTPQAEIEVLRSIYMGQMVLESVRVEDLARIIEILDTYRDAKIGFVDAAVVALAERLKITTVLTLDRRHFSLIKPRHTEAFDIRP